MAAGRAGPAGRAAGFTLIELVVTLLLVAVLAVAIVPRMSGSAFQARGVYDETLAALQYARKSAVAQRRTVCVAFAGGGLTVARVPAAGASDCSTASALQAPGSSAPLAVTPPSGVSVASTADFRFDPLGRPSAGVTVTVAGEDTRTIWVEPETGYVH